MKINDECEISISEFFDLVKKEGGTYEVETPDGFKPLGDLYIKYQKESCIIHVDGSFLGCSNDHRLMTKNSWKFASDLDLDNDFVEYNGTFVPVISREFVGLVDTYDFEVLTEEHSYLSNGFTSHNTSKTAIVKSLCNEPVEFDGIKYDGFEIVDVPIAQVEEMGDILGCPEKFIVIYKDVNGQRNFRSVIADGLVLQEYFKDGWSLNLDSKITTQYAPPVWVPVTQKPTLLVIDDGNRSSVRIQKGIMQLVQNYKTIAWSIPRGCTIVFTGNPDNNQYMVSSQDSAMITRMKHITMEPDAVCWGKWASSVGIDQRAVSFILRYPEMMCCGERTNLRSWTNFFYVLPEFQNISFSRDNDSLTELRIEGESCVDESSFNTFLSFLKVDWNLIIDPKDILLDLKSVKSRLIDYAQAKPDPRIDIINILMDRLYIHVANPKFYEELIPQKLSIFKSNIEELLTFKTSSGSYVIPPSTSNVFLRRVSTLKDVRCIVETPKISQFITELLNLEGKIK